LRVGDVALDFSRGEAAELHIEACRKARKPLLLGTTGHAPSIGRKLDAAAREIPLLVAPNTSLGIAVLLDLVERAARALPGDFDVEILEAHHRGKRDAPSGTALAIGETIAGARGGTLAERRAPPRNGARVRQSAEIGFAVVRAGDIVGEHEARFAGEGEELTLAHRATDRAVFARGAVKAAAWLAAQRPGRYAMADVLSLKSTV
jgi:4-hydroxy-tetrahydrodipicolinate reductase